MPTYAEWVSTAALSLSAVSLGWQVHRAAHDGPRLKVNGVEGIGFGRPDDPLTFTFAIQITNYGSKPTTITDVGWEREQEQGGIYSVRRSLSEPKLRAVHGTEVDGPAIPYRIDASDEVQWVMTQKYMDRFQSERLRAVIYTVGARNVTLGRLLGGTGKRERLVSSWIEVPKFGLTRREYLNSE